MKVTLERVNENFHFQLKNDRGHVVDVDARPSFGGNDMGASPMELVLMAVAGCSGIDMISILKKQRQDITSFKADVEGTREAVEEANPFKTIKVQFFLEGKVDPDKAWRAAQLSFDKYCSVSKTVEPTATVVYEVFVNGTPIGV
ncbi:disulfide bond formation regulator [Flavobacterium branchiophilum NBRC 15030 = ATCC 35035]|uniref:Disulfide bond formation regulator n=1 Tax=Flavobacterium branchiophilum TaxID=55197 RepID=A0A2H3KA61_9FLAO|nr:OsmC family protein [Flavobacterium branchiophilum]OXA77201.1 disulfide bond formation regulator [Flavobacterium branchiophilum NBRC 15030 = ATCC 35035]PDS23327.1 disulfide bond formation regulator [Flavobacterium branchiophilum]TQM39622.1 putative redox protein [Flavobacterium branchiophilum]GEM55725.1 osmotically inducible protein C [Flavobacterium branchiophilum NBRC 15030 = ATCC 35035]